MGRGKEREEKDEEEGGTKNGKSEEARKKLSEDND